ncbi:transposase family protein [Flectobacillus longus]|uniref:transposase family protein n=1 Tax=Flectobacillus longus TaxID=2984207 RepID=UPI0024B82F7C|nr:transposase family protein [Flectobacillus longus]MDI9882815.1 transposase family protein [Flectobacillus longus]
MNKINTLTTLNHREYTHLYSVFCPLMEERVSNYTLKGTLRKYRQVKESKLSSLYGNEAKLKFILQYLKQNPSQSFMAAYSGICQSKVSEWIKYLLVVLHETLDRLNFLAQRQGSFTINENLDYILCDVTERQVSRSTDYELQKEFYSGKKKTHTVKNLVFSDSKTYIHYLGETYEGSLHDKTLWDEICLKPSSVTIIADLGFLGVDKENENVIIPYKSSKHHPLTTLQKQINKAIAQVRVRVEHAFAGVKRLRVVKEKIRLRTSQILDRIMDIAVGLHNLRVTFRTINNKP